MIMPIIGVLISVALLITLAYRGWNIMIAAPLAALVAMIFSGAPVLGGYTEIFMPGVGGFVTKFLPIFLTGAIFGRLMTVSGYAEKIAQVLTRALGSKYAILATVLSTAILTYGGVSSFVVAFAAYPLARELFREADIPLRLLPAALMLGLATFTMSALPGTPQVQNIVPSQFFGTSTFAAPLLGLVGGSLIFLFGMMWLEYRARSLKARGESFETMHTGSSHKDKDARTSSQEGGTDGVPVGGSGGATGAPAGGTAVTTLSRTSTKPVGGTTTKTVPSQNLVSNSSWLPFVPLVVVIVMNFASVNWIIPALSTEYLSTPEYGERTVEQVSATWAVIIAMITAILSIFLLNLRHTRRLLGGLGEGAQNATLPLLTTGSEVGYGAVISSLAVFGLFKGGLVDWIPNALISSMVMTMIICAITASATGGLTISLNSFGPQLMEMANQQGISLEVMHRMTAITAGGFDTLPHNGAVIVVLLVTGMTHRQAYKDMAMVTIVGPLTTVALLLPFALML